jgi:NmrA-like family
MVRVVVLGAAGQLGREVVRALALHGHSVRAVVRRPPDAALDSSINSAVCSRLNKA